MVGPKGFTVPACTLDVRAGGTWRTVMRSPEGKDHIVSGVYREITPPERLVFTWAWEEGKRGYDTVVTIELFETPGGTRLELTHEGFESERPRPARRGLVQLLRVPGGGARRGRDRMTRG